MSLLNYYSIPHFFIWFITGRYIKITWVLFLTLSIGWELLEMVLPFAFAEEWIGNKLADILVNSLGFYLGKHIRKGVPNLND